MRRAMGRTSFLVLLATAASPVAAQAAPPKAAPPPYSLPWQLRPLTMGHVVRSDTTVAFYQTQDSTNATAAPGVTVATTLLATYKVTDRLAPLLRLALVHNAAPDVSGGPPSGTALVNPLVGASYADQTSHVRWSTFLGATLPLGMGGGSSPETGEAEAASRGIPARSAMDNALFAVNYLTFLGGVGAGYVGHGFTAQVELTLLELLRVRGSEAQDSARTNLTAGVHLGYFVIPMLSFGGELRYQRWLTFAAPVRMSEAARDAMTFAVGPRFHLKLNGQSWLRPGISYARALDAPLTKSRYQILQVDLPFVF